MYAHDQVVYDYVDSVIANNGMPMGRYSHVTVTTEQVAIARANPGVRPTWFVWLNSVMDDEVRKTWTKVEMWRCRRIQYDGLNDDDHVSRLLGARQCETMRCDHLTLTDKSMTTLVALGYVVASGNRLEYEILGGMKNHIRWEWRTPFALTDQGRARADNHIDHECLPDGMMYEVAA